MHHAPFQNQLNVELRWSVFKVDLNDRPHCVICSFDSTRFL